MRPDAVDEQHLAGVEYFPTELEIDLLTLVIRLEQINAEDEPSHWLWRDRVIGCDVARLRSKWISQRAQDWAAKATGT